MRKTIYIGAGGVIGAILRFLIKGFYAAQIQSSFPFDTLIINTLGCFLLAVVLSVAFEVLEMKPYLRLGIATGLLGAFTTFSTVCKEISAFLIQGSFANAILYASGSLILGVMAVFFGIALSREIMRIRDSRLLRSRPGDESEGR